MYFNIAFIIFGIMLLVKGGDFLIDGSVSIAKRAKLSPLVIGLTVVGFGTSMPELFVSAQAALSDSSAIAIGNVAGSNIANVLFILGVTALICPIPTKREMMRIDMPFFVICMLLLMAAASQGTIARWMGIAMVAILIGFISWEIQHSRKMQKRQEIANKTAELLNDYNIAAPKPTMLIDLPKEEQPAEEEKILPVWKAVLFVLLALVAMVAGANLLVEGASSMAMALGKSFGVEPAQMERIIGLTVVAIGTSLPELFASITAARKGQTDMAVGNVIGSGTFNILCVIGVSSAITPITNAWEPFAFDYFMQIAVALLLWLFLRTKNLLQRWEGAVFLVIYMLYMLKTALF